MRINWHAFFSVLFFLLLLLPLVQQLTRLPPVRPLGGAEVLVKAPDFRLQAWFDKTLQQEIESWYEAHIGFRPWMVRTANQITISLFDKVRQGKGTRVVLGQNDVLFEGIYVDGYNKPGHYGDDYLRAYTRGVARIQRLLEANNITFLLVIAPSKAEIYPEYLREEDRLPGRETRKSHYQRIRPLLDEFDIHYIDGHELFKQWKTEGAPWLFARGGTHWNYYGAGKIVGLLLETISRESGKAFDTIEVASYSTDSVPLGTDNDLENMLNRWFTWRTDREQIHPVYRRMATGQQPNLLMIGDSFALTLTEIMEQQQLFKRCDLLYYAKQRYSWPGATKKRIDGSRLDFHQELLGRDAFILEISEHNLPKFGFGVLRNLLAGLEAMDGARLRAAAGKFGKTETSLAN